MVALMLAIHRQLQTWRTRVDLYLTPTEFVRQKYIAGGFPAEKIVVKPHFVSAPPEASGGRRDYALFVGRLSQEKNILTLLTTWESVPDVPLKVIGSGPEESVVRHLLHERHLTNVELLGPRPHGQVLTLMQNARFLVSPTTLYETFGLVAIEAFACGAPVIASRRGALAEIVADGHTGLLFDPEKAGDFAERVRWAAAHPEAMAAMGQHARRIYEEKYTPEVNYNLLLGVYEQVLREATTNNQPARVFC
jgi:glycosyltransferase involved in cell wall biosynthesis